VLPCTLNRSLLVFSPLLQYSCTQFCSVQNSVDVLPCLLMGPFSSRSYLMYPTIRIEPLPGDLTWLRQHCLFCRHFGADSKVAEPRPARSSFVSVFPLLPLLHFTRGWAPDHFKVSLCKLLVVFLDLVLVSVSYLIRSLQLGVFFNSYFDQHQPQSPKGPFSLRILAG
jgi:hypothetical protein